VIVHQICFAYSWSYIPVLIRETFQNLDFVPLFGILGDNVNKRKGHSKIVKGIWRLPYHLQETTGALAISLTILVLRWFTGFLLDCKCLLLAVSFYNMILFFTTHCATSLSLLLLYCIFVLKLSFGMMTIVSVLGNINSDSSSKTNLPNHQIIYQFASLFEKTNL